MNIRISIKDCDSHHSHQLSEVDHKKKAMLYAPPERDTNKTRKNTDTQPKRTVPPKPSESNRQLPRQKIPKVKSDCQQTASVLQRQTEILESNQRIISDIVKEKSGKNERQEQSTKAEMVKVLDCVRANMEQIKRLRQEMSQARVEFARSSEKKRDLPVPHQMTEMNSNMKDLVEASKNHLQGLENLEGLKALQNFNSQGYIAAIDSIKKQIAQYQKQSQSIERELKIRAAKLEKLHISPTFEKDLYKPYEEHLNSRIQGIDLHQIRQKVYERIGAFDYGKFQFDIGQLMVEAKNQLNDFPIICRQHRIQPPNIKFDPKELKKMDIKIPSILDQYKAAKRIVLPSDKAPQQPAKQETKSVAQTQQINQTTKSWKGHLEGRKNLPRGAPIDLSHPAMLRKDNDKKPTILQNQNKAEKKRVNDNFQKTDKEKKKEDDDFEKYLENRAREQLELIYKARRESLQKMQNQLHEDCHNPHFQPLTIDDQTFRQIKKPQGEGKKPQEEAKRQQDESSEQNRGRNYEDDFEEIEEQAEAPKKKPEDIKKRPQQKGQDPDQQIKRVGRDVLKEKLRSILGNKMPPSQNNSRNDAQAPNQGQGIAENLIGVINHTLTQVNASLANVIERRIERVSEERAESAERRPISNSRRARIEIPKLQPPKAAPILNMNLIQQPQMAPHIINYPVIIPERRANEKIEEEDYDQYRQNYNQDFEDLNISDDGSDGE